LKNFALSVFAALIVALIVASNSNAEPASRDKCTCDLEPGDEQDNGAWVKNAAACWSNEYHARQWCDITVESLENDPGKQEFVGNIISLSLDDRGGEAAAMLRNLFENYFERQADADNGSGKPNFLAAANDLPSLFDVNGEMISQCLANFAIWHEKPGRFEPIEGDRLHCRIGESSGWLRIGFDFDEVFVLFMVAPNE